MTKHKRTSMRGWWGRWREDAAPDDKDVNLEERMEKAREARQEGRDALEQAYSQWREVADLAQVLHELRTRNHFAEQVKVMLQHAVPPPPKRR